MKLSGSTLPMFLCVALGGCGAVVPNRYVVRNATPASLSDVKVDCGGRSHRGKTIKAGREAWFFCYLPQREDIMLSYFRNGRREAGGIAYATPPMLNLCSTTVKAAGDPTTRCRSY